MNIINLLCILLLVPVINAVTSNTVHTKYGTIEGFVTEKCRVYLGVPYAKPPERWKTAADPEKWEGILEAKSVKPMCYQLNCTNTISCIKSMSEDCLYLNIYAPLSTKKSHKKAVMVWIHGGAFHSGSGSAPVYWGENFADGGNVIYVSINYRLGAFGFLKTGNGMTSAKGNYGFEDQRLALKWIRENIAAFGGNPKKITIFGQSAGASSILLHLLSSKSKHLFDQVIVQSPPIAIQAKDRKAVENQGFSFTKHLDCMAGDMECLRSKRPDEIVVAQEKAGTGSDNFFDTYTAWGPYVDADDIIDKAIAASRKGLMLPKPTIIGTTYDEGITYIYENIKSALPSPTFNYLIRQWRRCLNIPSTVKASYKNMFCNKHDSDSIYQHFIPKDISDARPEYTKLVTEFVFTCPIRNITRNHKSTDDIWIYVFNQSFPLPDIPGISKCASSACHAVELPFLFGSFSKLGIPSFPSKGDLRLVKDMLLYWTNFAKHGNPNGKGAITWPRYRDDVDNYLLFQSVGNQVISGYKNNICNFFDGIGYD